MRPFISSPGKAFIVGATREICAKLYEEIIKLRPDWHDDAVDKGVDQGRLLRLGVGHGLVAKHVRRDGRTRSSRSGSRTRTTRCRSSSSRT